MLAADFGRAYLPRDRLTPLAAYDVPGQRVTEDTDTKHTTVWTLAGKSTRALRTEDKPPRSRPPPAPLAQPLSS